MAITSLPSTFIDIALEWLASALTYIHFFTGMLLLLDDWRISRKRMYLLLALSIVLLLPVMHFGAYVALVKQSYFILVCLAFVLCYRKYSPVFWLALLTTCSMTGMCSILSGLFILPLGLQYRLFFKLPLCVLTLLVLRRYIHPTIRLLQSEQAQGLRKFCLLPASLILFLFFAELVVDNYVRNGQFFFVLIGLALLLIFSIAYGLLIYFFQTVYRRQKELYESELLQTEMTAVARHAAEINRQDEAERLFRHDLRHLMGAFTACVDAGEYEQAKQVARRFRQAMVDLEHSRRAIRRYTGYPVLDAVLTAFSARTEAAGVRFDVQLRLPAHLEDDMIEFSTMLSNAVENALHACLALPKETDRSIRITSDRKDGRLLLTVSNTCPAAVVLDPATGYPITNEPGHGYGVRSIASFAERHGGVLDYKLADGTLYLRLLF